MKTKGLNEKMDEIAHLVADKLLGGEEVTKELNDAFKTLAVYWTSATKLDKVSDSGPDAKGSDFSSIKQRIADAGQTNEPAGTNEVTRDSGESGGVEPIPFRPISR